MTLDLERAWERRGAGGPQGRTAVGRLRLLLLLLKGKPMSLWTIAQAPDEAASAQAQAHESEQ